MDSEPKSWYKAIYVREIGLVTDEDGPICQLISGWYQQLNKFYDSRYVIYKEKHPNN